jgi:hypothetical protein
MAVALLCRLPQRLAASDFVRPLAPWRFQLKAYRHAVEGIHIGDDGGQIHDLAIVKVMVWTAPGATLA